MVFTFVLGYFDRLPLTKGIVSVEYLFIVCSNSLLDDLDIVEADGPSIDLAINFLFLEADPVDQQQNIGQDHTVGEVCECCNGAARSECED